MGVRRGVLVALLSVGVCSGGTISAQAPGAAIPVTHATALDGRDVTLPRDLPARATVLILGFGRHSQDATTAWEKPTRLQLARPNQIGFFDMAMISEVPGFVRPFVVRSIKHAVPDVLKPNFLPLTDDEDAWKHVAGYAKDQPEAAYVMLVDRAGKVRWSTHAAFSSNAFAELRRQAEDLAKTP